MMQSEDLKGLTLVGPPWDNPETDPLAVLHLNNRLYIKSWVFFNRIYNLRFQCLFLHQFFARFDFSLLPLRWVMFDELADLGTSTLSRTHFQVNRSGGCCKQFWFIVHCKQS